MIRVAFASVAAAVALLASARAGAYTPSVDYALNCQGCHRADGSGTAGSIPPLVDSVARFLTVPGGREYLAQVPGVAQAPLDDAALAAVMNWLLHKFDEPHVPADFVPYAPDEVGRLRARPLTNVESVRARLLDDLARRSAR